MSNSYEELKQNNLSDEGREELDNGGYYEVSVFLDWISPPVDDADNYLYIDFILSDKIQEEFFDSIDFESEQLSERENAIASTLDFSLGELLERGLILDAYGNDHITSVDELEEHLTDFRIVGN